MHFFDSEDGDKSYRKNIDKEIAKAYKLALQYVKDRIGNYCASRGAEYMLVNAETPIAQVFFGDLTDKGVVK